MPKDQWKKAREQDHAKRARLERAAGMPETYEYVWEIDSTGKQVPVPMPIHLQLCTPSLPSKVEGWLVWLDGPKVKAQESRCQLEQLGPKDSVVIPVLVSAFRNPLQIIREAAIRCLAQIGGAAVPKLIDRLIKGTQQEQECSAASLGGIGAPSAKAVQELLESPCGEERKWGIRAAAMGAVPSQLLWKLLTHGTARQKESVREVFLSSSIEFVPFLISCLESESLTNGLLAIELLGELGLKARAALPVLEEITKSADESRVRLASAKAWAAIRQSRKVPLPDVKKSTSALKLKSKAKRKGVAASLFKKKKKRK